MNNRLFFFSVLIMTMLIFSSGCEDKFTNLENDISVDKTSSEKKESEQVKLKLVSVQVFQFGFEPDIIHVNYGDEILLTATSLDVGCGFALPDFGVNIQIPAEESKTARFKADQPGEFEFFNPVYNGAGWKNMTGKIIVT